MPLRQLITFTTAMPEIVVIVTNQIGDVYLNGQFLVAEVDTEANECPQCYGLMSYSEAYSRAQQAVEEIRIIASAVAPDGFEF